MVLPEVLALPFVQRAYVAALLVGSLLPTIGSFVVPKRLSLLGDTSAHIAFGAAAFASLIGIAFTDALAVPMTALATVLMLRLIRGFGVSGDVALTVFLTAGAALASASISLGSRVNLQAVLFGSILLVGPEDLLVMAVITAVVIGIVAFRFGDLMLFTLNEELARLKGIRTELLETLFAVVVAVSITESMKLMGVLMVTSLLVLPVVAASSVCTSLKRSIATSVAIAELSTISSVSLSYAVGLPPSSLTVLTLLALLLVMGAAGRRGLTI
jgi:zinc transport system permease protein